MSHGDLPEWISLSGADWSRLGHAMTGDWAETLTAGAGRVVRRGPSIGISGALRMEDTCSGARRNATTIGGFRRPNPRVEAESWFFSWTISSSHTHYCSVFSRFLRGGCGASGSK